MTFSEYLSFRLTEALIGVGLVFAIMPFALLAIWLKRKDKEDWWQL